MDLHEITYHPVSEMMPPASQYVLRAKRDSDGVEAEFLAWLTPEEVAKIRETGKIMRRLDIPRRLIGKPEYWTVTGWRHGFGAKGQE